MDTVEDVLILLESNDIQPKLPACMDRSPCCKGNIENENQDMMVVKVEFSTVF